MNKDKKGGSQPVRQPSTDRGGRTLGEDRSREISERYKRGDVTNTRPPPRNPDRNPDPKKEK